jgi:hypothetical protein
VLHREEKIALYPSALDRQIDLFLVRFPIAQRTGFGNLTDTANLAGRGTGAPSIFPAPAAR